MRNWKAWILALFLATVMWFFVVSMGDRVRKFPEQISVKAFNMPESASVVNPDELAKVDVYFSAPDRVHKQLTKDQINAFVDFSGVGLNEKHDLSVQVTLNNPEVKVVKIEPPLISVQLQDIVGTTLPVEIKTRGKLSEQYALGEITLDPRIVHINGPKELIEKAIKGVVYLNLSGDEKVSIERVLPVEIFGPNQQNIAGITIMPEEVRVKVEILQVTDTKVVAVRANITQGIPKTGFWLEKIEVKPATITIQGDVEALKAIDNVQTELIDINGIEADMIKQAEIVLPEGVQIAENGQSYVTVSIYVTSQESSRELFAPVKTVGVTQDLKVIKILPASVRVTVKGALQALQDLEEGQVYLNLNLAEHKKGEYDFSLNEDMIYVPYPLRLDSFETGKVTVELQEIVVQ